MLCGSRMIGCLYILSRSQLLGLRHSRHAVDISTQPQSRLPLATRAGLVSFNRQMVSNVSTHHSRKSSYFQHTELNYDVRNALAAIRELHPRSQALEEIAAQWVILGGRWPHGL